MYISQTEGLLTLDKVERAQLYYRETDQINLDLFNKEPWSSSILSDLEASPGYNIPNLVSKDEVENWARE